MEKNKKGLTSSNVKNLLSDKIPLLSTKLITCLLSQAITEYFNHLNTTSKVQKCEFVKTWD